MERIERIKGPCRKVKSWRSTWKEERSSWPMKYYYVNRQEERRNQRPLLNLSFSTAFSSTPPCHPFPHAHIIPSSTPPSFSLPVFHQAMSASTELALPEITLRPVVIDPSVEDRGSVREEGDKEEECHTPTSVESRLPTKPKSCPPAPKKPRRMIQCKRRLSELDLIVVGPEEMERLFCMRDRSRNLPPVIQLFKKQKRHK